MSEWDPWDILSDEILAATAVAVGMLFRYGKFTVDNLIHLVLDSPGDLQPTLWYICEFHSWRNSENWPITRPKSPSSSSSSSSERDDATATKKDLSLLQEEKQDQQLIIQRERNLEQKEKDFEQKEKDFIQKEKNLAQKETLLQQKLLQAELREREALEFEQEAKIKLDELDEKEQELEAEKLALQKNKIKNKNKGRFSTSSIPTHHDAENANDDDDNPTNENNDDNNQWLLRFSNLQQRLETAYREIEGLRRPVFPAAETTTTTITTATTANGDNDNNDNNNNDDNNDDNENENDNEKSSLILASLQHELKVMKENAQKLKEENLLLRKTMKEAKNFAFSEQNVSSERNVLSLRRRGIRDNLDVDNLVDVEEASSVGNRWAPLNFRVERMRRMGSATTTGRRREGEEEEEGIVGMIEMQKEFKFLGRLR